MEDTDHLVRRVRAGEVEAYAEIIRRHEEPVWRVVAAMLQRMEDARDIMQQVFLDAYVHLDQYKLGEDFGHWIKAIARNLVRKELRRLSRETDRLAVYHELLCQRLEDNAAAERYETDYLDALSACTDQLGEHTAHALRRRYHDGKTFSEIGAEFDMSPTAVEKLLSRVRLALRDCIQTRLATT